MQIGRLARASGVSVRMLRYYEAQGLLRPARTNSNYRQYSDADVDVVRRITLLNKAGLTLANIRPLLPCALPDNPGVAPCRALQDGIRRMLHDLDERIDRLAESRRLLTSFLGEGRPNRPVPSRAGARPPGYRSVQTP
jgi:DNA-binding transcriptional MerR regulator